MPRIAQRDAEHGRTACAYRVGDLSVPGGGGQEGSSTQRSMRGQRCDACTYTGRHMTMSENAQDARTYMQGNG